MIRVHVVRRGVAEGEFNAEGDECFLGKDEGTLLMLQGWRVGRRQLQFSVRNGEVFLTDGGGLAPVKVNGTAVNEYGPVSSTDVIELSDYIVRVNFVDPVQVQQKPLAREAPLAAVPEAEAPPPGAPGSRVVVAQGAPDGLERRRAARLSAEEAGPNPLELPDGIAARGALHKKLIGAMDLRRVNVSRMGDSELRETVHKIIDEIIETDPAFRAMRYWRSMLRDVVLNEVVGLGPLEALLNDDSVTEIMVNRHNDIFIERDGQLTRSSVSFSNDASVLAAIERIVSPLGRRIDESSPMVDARLKDGSRVNAIIPPLAIKGPSITIRKFARKKLTADDLTRFGAIDPAMVAFLRVAVEMRANIVISGGTGSGKTTLLNVLSNFIPDDERIVTVEDAAELQLSQPNLVSLEARPANIEGRGAITIRDLVKNCLRMRPDRIVVGECRGGEALDMLQAMNTGHDGSLTTAHANNPRDCLSRLEVMTLMSGLDIPMQAIREQICSAVNLIVQQTRFSCGTRRVTYITEVTGIENNVISMQDIFRFEQDGFTPEGKVRGRFVPTGHVPDFIQDLVARGIEVDMSIYARAAPSLPPTVKRMF
ncbi:ATPase, T2SS/T4P/T4SS family [Massilia sp. S19_KUP03_FR1]|uniref:ATPase, T2SS/T4P/T4SS family n=1 Tax=Massilia sp. S19_KUP03_FR1 TaxID=3025503 RepID=UPI002FCDDF6A